jgi:prepilin-type processing-associated H-X9-DG protein
LCAAKRTGCAKERTVLTRQYPRHNGSVNSWNPAYEEKSATKCAPRFTAQPNRGGGFHLDRTARRHRDYSSIIDDGQWAVRGSGFSGNYTKLNNTLTMRHSGKAEVQYGDGHAMPATYKQAEDTNAVVAVF